MKPWMVAVYDNPASQDVWPRRDGRTGRIYCNRDQPKLRAFEETVVQRDCHVAFFDDENTADLYIQSYTEQYPGRTLVKAQSLQVHYTEIGPVRRGRFTPQGMIPE